MSSKTEIIEAFISAFRQLQDKGAELDLSDLEVLLMECKDTEPKTQHYYSHVFRASIARVSGLAYIAQLTKDPLELEKILGMLNQECTELDKSGRALFKIVT